MKTNYRLCVVVSGALLLSHHLTRESRAQESATAPARPTGNATPLAAASPDGQFFVTATAAGRITHRRVSDGATLRTFYLCHARAVEFSPDGRMLAALGATNGRPAQIKVWQVNDGQLLGQWGLEDGTEARPGTEATGRKASTLSPPLLALMKDGKVLMFSADSQWLLARRQDGESVGWNLALGRGGLGTNLAGSKTQSDPSGGGFRVGEPTVITGSSAGLAFSRDGARLTSGNSVWASRDGALLVGNGKAARQGRPAFSPEGDYVANGFDILEAGNGKRVTTVTPGFENKNIYGVAFSPDGKTMAFGKGNSGDGVLTICAVPSGEVMQTLGGHTNPVWDVAFSPDGRFLASASGRWQNYQKGGGPGEVRLWDVNSGETIQVHSSLHCLYSISFSGDGRRFATSGGVYHAAFKSQRRGEIRVWDADSGEEVFAALGLSSCVYSMALSPDGKRLVAAVGPAGELGVFDVKLWDVETGHEIVTLGSHGKKVYGVAFSTDGKRIASGGLDDVIQIWSLE